MRYSPERKEQLLVAWKEARQANVLQAEFCRANGLAERTLRAWIRDEEPAGIGCIDKARQILRETSRRLLEMANALVVDDGLATEKEIQTEVGCAGDVPLEDMPAGESGTEENETSPAGMPKEEAAGSFAGGKSGDLGNGCASSSAAGSADEGQAVNGEPGRRKNRRGWDF